MKNRNFFIYLNLISVFFILLFTTCNDKEDLFITDITDQVDFIHHPFYNCFSPKGEAYQREVIFTDNAAYQEFGAYTIAQRSRNQIGCETATLPPFDFNKQSIIGKYIHTPSSYVGFNYRIIDNPLNKTIKYSIKIEYLNIPSIGHDAMNWAIIPKLKEKYTVVFEVELIEVDEFSDPN